MQEKAQAHSRVVQLVLSTLTSFVDWVSITHIMESNGRLLKTLCILLNDPEFQNSAAECLTQITNRKRLLKDRKPLMMLLEIDAMTYIFQAINRIDLWTSESYYSFLKKMMQILFGLSTQITAVWPKDDPKGAPSNFCTFLEMILLLSKHPSLSITHEAVLIWLQLAKHETIMKNQNFLCTVPNLIRIIGPKVRKVKILECFFSF